MYDHQRGEGGRTLCVKKGLNRVCRTFSGGNRGDYQNELGNWCRRGGKGIFCVDEDSWWERWYRVREKLHLICNIFVV